MNLELIASKLPHVLPKNFKAGVWYKVTITLGNDHYHLPLYQPKNGAIRVAIPKVIRGEQRRRLRVYDVYKLLPNHTLAPVMQLKKEELENALSDTFEVYFDARTDKRTIVTNEFKGLVYELNFSDTSVGYYPQSLSDVGRLQEFLVDYNITLQQSGDTLYFTKNQSVYYFLETENGISICLKSA